MSQAPTSDSGPHEAWYARFFKRDYLHFYGRTLGAERTDHETQFAIRTLSLKPGHCVLDLCCGQGRHSIALANTGVNVTGVDLSEEMLAIARETSQHMSTPPDFIQADMRNLPQTLNGKFDAAINMFSSFGYLETESDDQAVLHQIANALKPGGQMMMDLLNRELSSDTTSRSSGKSKTTEPSSSNIANSTYEPASTTSPSRKSAQTAHAVHRRSYTCAYTP